MAAGEHIARITYVNSEYGTPRASYHFGLERAELDQALDLMAPLEHEGVAWIDFRSNCDCGCNYTFGSSNAHRLCGETYVAIDHQTGTYEFATARELVAEPAKVTDYLAKWLRLLQRVDSPHAPMPTARTDEVRAVAAILPMQKVVDLG